MQSRPIASLNRVPINIADAARGFHLPDASPACRSRCRYACSASAIITGSWHAVRVVSGCSSNSPMHLRITDRDWYSAW
jgi:hypothetical protein